MSAPLPPSSTIGIVGGGQLGRMLAMAAARLGYRTTVLEPDPLCPAAQVANRQIAAAYDDEGALALLAGSSAVVTYEFENVPLAAADFLAERVPLYPPPAALGISQDRLVEKQHLRSIGASTAGFEPVDNDGDLARALEAFGGKGLLKTRRLGYDGKGQRLFRGGEPVEGACAAMGDVPLLLEELIAFECEFSIIGVRGRDGSFAAYDPARNVHQNGILHSSTVPADIPQDAVAEAVEQVRRLAESLDYVGVIGVEFFLAGDGRVLVNEFAPRVHNSGHWTEAACVISQFEQHVRAITGLALGSTRRHADCVMVNLIGDAAGDLAALAREPDTLVHLYGKAEARPGRKMGHYTRLNGPIR